MAVSIKNMLGGGGGSEKDYKLNVETTYVNTIRTATLARSIDTMRRSDNGYYFGFYNSVMYVFDSDFNEVGQTNITSYTSGSVSYDCDIKRIGANKYFMAVSQYYNSSYYTFLIMFEIADNGTVNLNYKLATVSYRPYYVAKVSDTRLYVFVSYSSYAQMYTVDIGSGIEFTYTSTVLQGQTMTTIYPKELSNNTALIYGTSGICYIFRFTAGGFTLLYSGWLHDSAQSSAFSNFEVVEYNGDIHILGVASNGIAYPTYDVKYTISGDTVTKEQVVLARNYSDQGKNAYFNDGLANVVPHFFINTEDANHIYAYGWTNTSSNPFNDPDIKEIGGNSMFLELGINSNGFFEVVNCEYISIVMLENYLKYKVYSFMGANYLTAYIAGNTTFGVDASTLPTYRIDEKGKPNKIILPHNKIWGFSNGQVMPNYLHTYKLGNMLFMSTGHSGNYGRPYMCHVLKGDGENVAIESVLEGVDPSASRVYYAVGHTEYLKTLEDEFYICERDNTRDIYKVNVELVEA